MHIITCGHKSDQTIEFMHNDEKKTGKSLKSLYLIVGAAATVHQL